MARVTINPGICGLRSTITAKADDEMQVQVGVESACPAIQAMETKLQALDGYAEVFGKWGSSTVSRVAELHCTHAACPVPSGILKAVEISCGLALPSAVVMEISKED